MKKFIVLVVLLGSLVYALPNKIYTLEGKPEFDRSAAAWVYQRFGNTNVVVVFCGKTNIPNKAVSFDFIGSSIERPGNQTAFGSMIRHLKLKDPILTKIVPILRDIEINKWGKKKTAEAPGLIVIHNGFVFKYETPEQVMKSDWLLLDAIYQYYLKTGK